MTHKKYGIMGNVACNNSAAFDKEAHYSQALVQAKDLIVGIDNHIGALANVTALFKESFPYYSWIGFYIVDGDTLKLGPFQGPVACYEIKKGKGVCGTAWKGRQTVIVPDVLQFPGHIACSSRSRSEIVVPIFRGDEVIAVIDVDSESFGSFDSADQYNLEQLADILTPFF